MQDLRLWLTSSQSQDDDKPRLYVQMRLNYTDLPVCNRSKLKEIQRLYNWLSVIRSQVLPSDQTVSHPQLADQPQLGNNKKRAKIDDQQRLINLTRRYQKLKNFTKLNLEQELTGYLYGSPPKASLDQMQIQLRCYTGERCLLLKVSDDRKVREKKVEIGEDKNDKGTQIGNEVQAKKENELVVSLDMLPKVFKNLNSKSLSSEDGSLVLELTGYRFRAVLVLVYALYTNQLYLSLDSFSELVQVALDLGVEQVLRFINQLILNEDPIYVLFKLRNYLTDLARLSDLNSLTTLARQMAAVLRQVVVHYDRIIQHPAILDLTFSEIHFLVWKSNEAFGSFGVRTARNELDVIRAILDWYAVDRERRDQQAICLLAKVDYGRLTGEQLENLANSLLLNGYSDEVNAFLRSQFACESKRRPTLALFQEMPRFNRPDPCLSVERLATLQAGEPPSSESRLSALKSKLEPDNREEQEQELKELLAECLKKFLHLGSFSLGGGLLSPIYSLGDRSIMLLLGGFRSTLSSKDQGRLMYHLIGPKQAVALPSLLTHDWFQLRRRLPKSLAHFAAVRVLNCVFVIGGLDLSCLLLNNERKRVKPTASCYVFSLATSEWYKIKSMNSSRAFHSAVNYEQLIYVFGGLTLSSNQLTVTGTMEFYDIAKNSWFLVNCEPSPSARMSFGMELIDGNKLCIVGGIRSVEDKNLNFSSTALLDDFWCFNLDNKTFAEIIKLRLPVSRASFGLIRHRDELLLVGGLEISGESGGACGSNHLTAGKMNATKKNMPATTGDVLACRLLRSNSEWPQFVNCKLQEWNRTNDDRESGREKDREQNRQQSREPNRERDRILVPESNPEHHWYLHSKLKQPRIFPAVSRLPDTLLVAGGSAQDHLYLKRTSLAKNCSTYEVLNGETTQWIESPIMFATFGSSLISLH